GLSCGRVLLRRRLLTLEHTRNLVPRSIDRWILFRDSSRRNRSLRNQHGVLDVDGTCLFLGEHAGDSNWLIDHLPSRGAAKARAAPGHGLCRGLSAVCFPPTHTTFDDKVAPILASDDRAFHRWRHLRNC